MQRIIFAAVLVSVACATPPPPPVAVQAAPQPPPVKILHQTLADAGLDLAAMDRTIDPCTDFYHFACGNWLKDTPIPDDRSRWSRSFSEIDKRKEETLRDILEKAKKTPTDDLTKRIGEFYGACMDEEGIEKHGIEPLDPYLKIARSVKDRESLLKALLQLHRYSIPVLFDLGASQDGKDATKMIANLDQSGLGLPDRSFYLDDDATSKETREFYKHYLEHVFVLVGSKEKAAKEQAEDVFTLETEIAKISKSKVERRDPQGMYNKIDLDGLKKTAPDFPWDQYFKSLDHPAITEISVTSPPFFKGMNDLIAATKPAVWRNYLEFHIISAATPMLPKAFVDEGFALTQKLTGQKKIQDRWKRCVQATDGALGELVAQPFVKEKFGGESKTATQTMVSEIRDAFGRNLAQLDWMDEATRGRAAEKLKAVSFLIGYPDKWKEYNFAISPADYAGNVFASREYELQRELNKIGKPVDRGEWDMTPPTVNAYYDPQKNQMVFPAGILQPPFFNASFATAVNMGGIGFVIGHELTHGFDDEGAQYDAQGNLRNWWEPSVSPKFQEKGKCIEDQYGKYSPLPGKNVNGKLTEGENIADNGGLKMAFRAYRDMRAASPEQIVADGFNEDQMFFLAAGQVWCMNSREQVVDTLLRTDPHSPPMFRVMGPMSNLPEFATAFGCKDNSAMKPANQCKVW